MEEGRDPAPSAPLLVGCGTEHAVYRYNGSDPRLSGCVLKLSHAVVAARAASVAPLPALVQALGLEYAAEPICAVPLESSLACALSDAARHGVPPARFVARAVYAAMEAAVAEAAPGKLLPLPSPSSGQQRGRAGRTQYRRRAGNTWRHSDRNPYRQHQCAVRSGFILFGDFALPGSDVQAPE